MQTGCFKKFLEVVFGRLSLSLEVTLGSRYEPLTGGIGFLTAVIVAGHYGNVMGSVLLLLLAARSTFHGAFDGGLDGRSPATAGGRSCVS
jgi:hypothetical protein